MKKSEIRKAIERLREYRPGFLPDKQNEYYEQGDEKAPFFSEAYLYNLLGKEEGRVLLALMRPIWEIDKPSWEEKCRELKIL